MEIILSDEIRQVWPQLCVAAIEASVINTPHNDSLWEEIFQEEKTLSERYSPDSLKSRPGIEATRKAYRALGKDPSRYRPSNEALVRRFLQGKHLYEISTLVDLNNLASIRWAYSIGGFDLDLINGNRLILGIGQKDEPYEGIGRGPLNIENLPVYRDLTGGIGTPTSDNERTKISLSTRRLLVLVNGYDGNCDLTLRCGKDLQELLSKYAQSDGGTLTLITGQ